MDRILNPLYPLDEFYAQAGGALPFVRPLPGEEVPEPYRQILVHGEAMTATLEAFHGERTHLRVLARRQDGEALWRQVVLRLNGSDRPVEFAAIVIHLQHFPLAAREEVLEGRRPLGAILKGHRMEWRNTPLMYLRVRSDAVINEALHLTGSQPLYGRRNVIRDVSGRELAETLEIVPPTAEDAGSSRQPAFSPQWAYRRASADHPFPYRQSPVAALACVSRWRDVCGSPARRVAAAVGARGRTLMVEKAGSTEVAKVREAARQEIVFAAPEGEMKVDGPTQHTWAAKLASR
jgi:chorismate-pyruvate lyase